MEFVKLIRTAHGNYSYKDASSIEMTILGDFLSDDLGCDGRNFFRDWALSGEREWVVGGNITFLEKVENYIYLTNQTSQEEAPAELKMTIEQLVRVIDKWRERVCKKIPKEVIIKRYNGEFLIETKD